MEEQQDLKTDYQDYSFMGNKKFNLINNPDGTVSFEDVTDYETEGDDFGSNDINAPPPPPPPPQHHPHPLPHRPYTPQPPPPPNSPHPGPRGAGAYCLISL